MDYERLEKQLAFLRCPQKWRCGKAIYIICGGGYIIEYRNAILASIDSGKQRGTAFLSQYRRGGNKKQRNIKKVFDIKKYLTYIRKTARRKITGG